MSGKDKVSDFIFAKIEEILILRELNQGYG